MKKGYITLKDIALELNLSINAVSKALRNSDDISAKTKQLVKNKAIEMGYIPSYEAQALKHGQTSTIAVILNDLLNPFFSILSHEIVNDINSLGLKCSIIYCQNHLLDFETIQNSMTAKYCGIISLVEPTDEVINFYANKNIPFYLIGIRLKSPLIDCYYSDDKKGGRLVGEYFVSSPCKKALYITNSLSETSYRRFSGFSQVVETTSKDYEIIPFQLQDDILSKAYHKIANENFDFVFCFSDYLAIKLKRLLKKNKLKEKVVIFGFDNLSDNYDIIEPINSVGTDMKKLVLDACTSLYNKVVTKNIDINERKQIKYDVFLSLK